MLIGGMNTFGLIFNIVFDRLPMGIIVVFPFVFLCVLCALCGEDLFLVQASE